jgi:hypothetical protein
MLSRQTAALLTILSTGLLFVAQAQATPAGADRGDDTADPVTKVQKLNRYAMQLFDDGNFALAEKTLIEALQIVDKSNLGNSPAGLATHGNLAVLYSIGLKNPDKAVGHFKKALAVKPDLRLSKQRATPETEANLARAKFEMGLATSPPSAAAPASAESRAVEPSRAESGPVSGLKCPSGGEVQAGSELTVECATGSDIKVKEVALFFKGSGSDQFQMLPMTQSGSVGGTTSWVARIPGSATKGKWVPIYFEARNGNGKVVASSGRESSPNVVLVKGGEDAADDSASAASDEDDEDDEEEIEEIDDDNPLARLEKERRREHQGSKGTWWLSLGVGSGLGYASGHATEAYGKYGVAFNPGLAPTPLGFAVPEIGYFVGRNTAISLAGRLQGIFPRGPKGTATGALTGLLRILFFTEDEGKLRWYFAAMGGGGEGFRFQVEAQILDQTGSPTGTTVKDTVRGGPWVAGYGGGMLYKINRRFRWTVDVQQLWGFTDFSVVILDLSTGLRWQF